MVRTETVREIHSRDESSFGSRAADMRNVGIFVVLTQGADDASVKGDLGREISQV